MSIFNKKPKMSPEEKEIKEVEPMGKYAGLSLENFLKIFEYVKYTKKKWFTVSVEILLDIHSIMPSSLCLFNSMSLALYEIYSGIS